MNFIKRLQTEAAFNQLESWEQTQITSGTQSGNVFRLTSGEQDLFIKEITDHERDIHKQLLDIKLKHVLKSKHPDLLEQNILVTDFVSCGSITTKQLDHNLIVEFATIQNTLLPPGQDKGAHAASGEFFRKGFAENIAAAGKRMVVLKQEAPTIAKEYTRLVEHMQRNKEKLTQEFAAIPAARQHHDFREANILAGPPQRLIDWGSSYGDGPFIFDLAPFLLADQQQLEIYVGSSDICRVAQAGQIEEWLVSCALARLAEMLRYLEAFVIKQENGLEDLTGTLEYQFESYGKLLEYI